MGIYINVSTLRTDEFFDMRLSENITTLCKKKGWKLAELSRKAGIPNQTLHNWLTGRTSVNPVQLKKVAAVLEVSLFYLIFGEADPYEQPSVEVLKEIFSGDVRVTLHRIEQKRGK